MTAEQLDQIAALRRENYSYRFIGNILSISPNTVKSICRRNGFTASGNRKTRAEKQNAALCKNCLKPLTSDTRKGAEFCSDACRTAWWRKNRRITQK